MARNHDENSGGLIAVSLFIFGFLCIAAPIVLSVFDFSNMIATLVLEGLGLVLIVLGAYAMMYKKFFIIPLSYQAIVRTGKNGKRKDGDVIIKEETDDGKKIIAEVGNMEVFIGTGAWCIPIFHKYFIFDFATHVLSIDRKEKFALICNDNILADVSATFKVSVPQNRESVLKFLAASGSRDPNLKETYEELVNDTLDTALRDTCTSKEYAQVFNGRVEAGSEIEKSVGDDFPKMGIQLESAKLTDVNQTNEEYYNKSNAQHAIGKTKIVNEIEDQRLAVETKKLKTQEEVRRKTVEKEKAVFKLDLDEATAKANKERDEKKVEAAAEKEVKNAQAEANKEAETFAIEQRQETEQREIEKQEAIETAEAAKEAKVIEAEKLKEVADVQKTQAIDVANKQKEQATKVAEVSSEKAEDLAKRQQQIEIAKKEKEQADAEADKLASEKIKEENAQAVLTVTEVKSAERAKQKMVIDAQADAEADLESKKKAADAEAYKIERDAEARETSAKADYGAKVKGAEAVLIEKEKAAAGDEATQMVAVNVKEAQVAVDKKEKMIVIDVAKEQVTVNKEQVAVDKQALEQTEQFGKAGIDFELSKLQIEQTATVEIAKAGAVATMMQSVKANVYGSPDDLTKMATKFADGMSVPNLFEGLLHGLKDNPLTNAAVKSITAKAGELTTATVSHLSGKNEEKVIETAATPETEEVQEKQDNKTDTED